MSQLSDISKIAPKFGQERYSLDDLKSLAETQQIIFWERDLPININGIFVAAEKNKYIIINSKLNNPQKEFALAHELAHYFLKHVADIFYGNISGSQAEFEASLIALIFLLPDLAMKIELPRWEIYFGGKRDHFFYEFGVDILKRLKVICINFRSSAEMTPLKKPTTDQILKESLELIERRKEYTKGVIECKLWLMENASFYPKKN